MSIYIQQWKKERLNVTIDYKKIKSVLRSPRRMINTISKTDRKFKGKVLKKVSFYFESETKSQQFFKLEKFKKI